MQKLRLNRRILFLPMIAILAFCLNSCDESSQDDKEHGKGKHEEGALHEAAEEAEALEIAKESLKKSSEEHAKEGE